MTPEERTAGKLAAVAFALKGATITYVSTVDSPEGIAVDNIEIRTLDGTNLLITESEDEAYFLIYSLDDPTAPPVRSVFDWIKKDANPCAGCPGVEGGCSEHPAECGVSCGRWRRS